MWGFFGLCVSVKGSGSELAKSYWTRFETGTLLHLVSTRPIGEGLPSKIRETSESSQINANINSLQFSHSSILCFLSNIYLDDALQLMSNCEPRKFHVAGLDRFRSLGKARFYQVLVLQGCHPMVDPTGKHLKYQMEKTKQAVKEGNFSQRNVSQVC